MTITLTQEEVLEALKSVFGYPAYSTMEVIAGRKGVNSTRFIIDIPALTREPRETESVEKVSEDAAEKKKEELHLFSGHEDFEQ
jgi:hypothetical protein